MIEQDIWNWITNFVERNHEFYNFKFPPCPYAKSARLKGLVKVCAYESGSYKDFIQNSIDSLIKNKTHTVCVMVFPYYLKWYYHLHRFIRKINAIIVKEDFYMQYGLAVESESKYSGLFQNKPYFIVIVNKLSQVNEAHDILIKTDYYGFWDKKHYDEVVNRRKSFK